MWFSVDMYVCFCPCLWARLSALLFIHLLTFLVSQVSYLFLGALLCSAISWVSQLLLTNLQSDADVPVPLFLVWGSGGVCFLVFTKYTQLLKVICCCLILSPELSRTVSQGWNSDPLTSDFGPLPLYLTAVLKVTKSSGTTGMA